jgi:hypothetical protein
MGGLWIDAPKYSTENREKAINLINGLRSIINLPNKAEKGTIFKYTQGVLWRLESLSTEQEFLEYPVFNVTDALIDAAKSDYWYRYEKQYKDNDYYDDNENWEVE